MQIKKAREIGFCFGVCRAIDILKKSAREQGGLQTLGPVVHNERVTQELSDLGIKVVDGIDKISGNVVAISSHGLSPEVEEKMRAKKFTVIDTTCPFVKRAQVSARKLAEAGFLVLVFGESQHPEVKGILGWAKGKGLASLDVKPLICASSLPRRIGILAQTTQIPENFTKFVKDVIDITLIKDAEIRIIDTICHDIRQRQSVSLDLAKKVDLMLVVGGRSSANTRRLVELCSPLTPTHLISEAGEILPEWLAGKKRVGITSGTSTPEETITEVVDRLKALNKD
jgi:4-hydroxy-3-methylbut-2-en-1-yl diphosphate reductase